MRFFYKDEVSLACNVGWGENLREKTPGGKSEQSDECDVDDPKHDPAIGGNPRDDGGRARLLKNHTERGGQSQYACEDQEGIPEVPREPEQDEVAGKF